MHDIVRLLSKYSLADNYVQYAIVLTYVLLFTEHPSILHLRSKLARRDNFYYSRISKVKLKTRLCSFGGLRSLSRHTLQCIR